MFQTFIAVAIAGASQFASAGPNMVVPGESHKPTPAAQEPRRVVAAPKADQSKTIVRRHGEAPDVLARRVLPHGARTITKPLEMAFAPLGKVVLILFELNPDAPGGSPDADSIYQGWMLAPDGEPEHYRVEMLPPIVDGFGRLDYTVKSVFTADSDGDGAPELCVLSEVNEVGSGDDGRPTYDTDIFKWSVGTFSLVNQSDKRPLDGLRTARAVRGRLKKMLVEHSAGITSPLR